MPKFVKACRSDFTTFHNAMWRDRNLGLTERGLLGTMITLPDEWDFSTKGLSTLFPDGEHKVGTALKKLEKAGYLKREQIRENGRIVDWKYTYSDEPIFLRENNISSDTDGTDSEPAKLKQSKQAISASNVENYVENHVEKPHCENRNLADMSKISSPHCGFPDVENQDLENRNANKIYNNKINNNKYLSHQVSSRDKRTDENIHINVENSDDMIDEMDFDRAVAEVSEQISADSLYCNNSTQAGVIDEIIEVIAAAYTTERQYLKVSGDNLDIALVRKRLRSLDSGHIEYVLECISNSSTAIKNRKNYLLTSLFNAPITMDGYYANQVAHDLFRGG